MTRANMRVSDRSDQPETDRYYSTKSATTSCPAAVQWAFGHAPQHADRPARAVVGCRSQRPGSVAAWPAAAATTISPRARPTSAPAWLPTSVPIGQAFRRCWLARFRSRHRPTGSLGATALRTLTYLSSPSKIATKT